MTSVARISPEGLHRNPAFSQAVRIERPDALVLVGGQNAVDPEGAIVGDGDVGAQAAQILRNLETALDAAGARLDDVVSWNVRVVDEVPMEPAFRVFMEAWADRGPAPLVTVSRVAGLAHPAFLMELDAVAVPTERP